MTPVLNNNLVVIPNNLYKDALSYFPKKLVDDMFIMSEYKHTGTIVCCDIYKSKKYHIDVRLDMIEKHNRTRMSEYWIYVPMILFVLDFTLRLFLNLYIPTIVVSNAILAIVTTLYIHMTIQYGLEKVKYGLITLTSIQSIIQLAIKQKLVDEYKTNLATTKEHVELANIDSEEIRARYEGMLNYFHSVDPELTNDYIDTVSSDPIFVIQNKSVQ